MDFGPQSSQEEGRWSRLPTLKATSLASRGDLGSDVRHPAALELRPGGGGEYQAPEPESHKQMAAEKGGPEAGRADQVVKSLLCKHKGLRSDPSTDAEIQAWRHMPIISALGR